MQTAVFVVLAVVCAVLGFRVWMTEKSLRACARQLCQREIGGDGSGIRITVPDRAMEELLAAINRLLEQNRAATREYRRQERVIRQQISNISHDLRTPLTSILGYLQLLDGDALTPAERTEYLAVVQSRAKSLQSLITSFYDLSRLEGGEYPLLRVRVDLYRVLSALVAEFYNDLTGFQMTVELEEGLPAVSADPSGVQRVFINLISNALEHGREQLSIRLYRAGDAVVSSFSNDAEGLTEEDVTHVFDRFFTADKMRTGRSTGLGLSIVSAMTAQMGHAATATLEGGVFTVAIRWNIP